MPYWCPFISRLEGKKKQVVINLPALHLTSQQECKSEAGRYYTAGNTHVCTHAHVHTQLHTHPHIHIVLLHDINWDAQDAFSPGENITIFVSCFHRPAKWLSSKIFCGRKLIPLIFCNANVARMGEIFVQQIFQLYMYVHDSTCMHAHAWLYPKHKDAAANKHDCQLDKTSTL